jgi:hypothetical protein
MREHLAAGLQRQRVALPTDPAASYCRTFRGRRLGAPICREPQRAGSRASVHGWWHAHADKKIRDERASGHQERRVTWLDCYRSTSGFRGTSSGRGALCAPGSGRIRCVAAVGSVGCMRAFKSHAAAGRFCREHDELRKLLRVRSHHNQYVSASRRFNHFLHNARIALSVMQAA